jgi:hypothetical protein
MDVSFFNGSVTIRALIKNDVSEPTLGMLCGKSCSVHGEKLLQISQTFVSDGRLCVVMPGTGTGCVDSMGAQWCIVAVVVQGPVQVPYTAVEKAEDAAIGEALELSTGSPLQLKCGVNKRIGLVMNTHSVLKTMDILL